MNKRHTLIHSGVAIDNPHQYHVTIGTDIGQFSGIAICRPEDYKNESRYFGFELAEIKAEIQYARAKRNYYEAQLKALTQFWRDMSTTRTYDQDAFWVKKMREKVSKIEIERQHWVEAIKNLKRAYYMKITTFDSLNAKRNRCKEYNND